MKSLSRENQADIIKASNSTSGYLLNTDKCILFSTLERSGKLYQEQGITVECSVKL